jgi:hypothetical protein
MARVPRRSAVIAVVVRIDISVPMPDLGAIAR